MSLIECSHASFSYGGRAVISDVTFRVNTGDYLCIVGENGAGKSTLMKGLLQLKKPDQGSIRYGDGLKPSLIGYLPQQSGIQKDFPASVKEVVLSGCLNRLGRRLFYTSREHIRAGQSMRLMGISGLASRCYRELSGGQRQRVLLARALCAADRMLLLDEPAAGLDPLIAHDLYRTIRALHNEQKLTVVMISHDIRGAVREADHILHLAAHRTFFGTVDAYLSNGAGAAFAGEKGSS